MLKIGLLGASRISLSAVLAPAAQRDDVQIACVAARDKNRAADFARQHGIPHVTDDYASLVASEHVDLVFNGLPPSGHAHWSIAALQAGKHVLCEKPFAMNAEQARAMVAAAEASGRRLIEAFHYRFHPLFNRVLEILRSGTIGTIERLESHFNVPIENRPGELRFDAALGGGAMMDLGCYPVHWVRTVMGEEPEVRSAKARQHGSGVDVAMEAELAFSNGVCARVNSSMSQDLPDRLDAELTVIGKLGRLTVFNPLAPHAGHELTVETQAETTTEQIAGKTTYDHQLEHVLAVLRGDTEPLTGGSDAVGNMHVLDEIYRHAGMRAL